MLWFDVESRYKATHILSHSSRAGLWFDVESIYKATKCGAIAMGTSCGLM